MPSPKPKRPSPTRTPAEVWHPGVFVREEAEARGWEYSDVEEHCDQAISAATVRAIVIGEQDITDHISGALGEAFGVNPEFFLNLQRLYDAAVAGGAVAHKR